MANPLRKTMVYLGLADEEQEYEQAAPTAPAAPVAHAVPATGNKAPVTPLRQKPTTRTAGPVDMNEILTVHPRQYKDAQVIAESFREGIPVIINLSQMSEPDARRLIDFASGLSQGLYGKIERVTNKVFLLSPAHVSISGEQAEADSDVEASFFAQS
jgi:cell division inhibitor SepF